jgi:hypothetical protein
MKIPTSPTSTTAMMTLTPLLRSRLQKNLAWIRLICMSRYRPGSWLRLSIIRS